MATSRALRPGVRHVLCVAAASIAGHCAAAGLDVAVVDERGAPIALAAVYAVPDGTAAPVAPPTRTAVMDQSHNAFVPQVLVVQTGTLVDFPNNDTVSHHVYSFSEAKTFEIPLYKGNGRPPVAFEKPGLVVLGCNIHDEMLGYILVVDTPYFALTDTSGKAHLATLPTGGYSVHVWTSRARPQDLPDESQVTVDASTRELAFQVKGKLMPEHDHGGSGLTWQRY